MNSTTIGIAAHNRTQELMQSAQKLESAFVSQMLKSAGLGELKDSFSGGVGEEQFASFMRDEQAKAIVQNGGFGLAEPIFAALMRAEND